MSRLGRGRPTQGFIPVRALALDVRSGSVAIHGGGTVALASTDARSGSVAIHGGGTVASATVTRTNYVTNPSFEVDAAGWSTSAFSVSAGASLSRDTSNGPYPRGSAGALVMTGGVDQGICAAAPDLGTFTAGTTYYAHVSVQTATFAFEVVLGSTADDFTSVQVTGTGSQQVVELAWTPSADRSASNHGIAIRTKSATSTALLIDTASIGTYPGYIDGDQAGAYWLGTANASTSRLGGGKGARSSAALSGGGTVTTGALTSSASGSTAAHGGGSIATTGVKNATAVTVTHGGGSGVLTGASTQNTGFLPGIVVGGGGRVARSHPSPGLAQPGVIPTVIAGTTARTGTVAISAGGTVTTSTAKGARAATTDTAAGSLTITAAKGALSTLTSHGGGSIATSGAATPSPGGIVGGGMLTGGGGRFGRSHVGGVISHAQPTLTVASADNRAGTVAGTGGGGIVTTGRKGGISTTSVAIPAPPPEMVDVLMLGGVLVHGGGSITVTYNRSASQIGSVAITGGGSIATTGARSATGASAASAGGTVTLAARKGARSATTTTGGGTITTTYVLGQAVSHSIGISGGGTVRTTGAKTARGSVSASSGGTLRTTGIKKVAGATSATGGGTVTLVGSQFGPQASGAVAIHGGGTINLTASKAARAVVSGTGGGRDAEAHAKQGFGSVRVSGGGSLLTVRVDVPIPTYRGLVDADTKEELSVPVLLRR